MNKNNDVVSSFIYGVASSAFQIEGATAIDGRVDSIWDTFCQKEGAILNGDNADVTCDYYHLWERDLELLKNLGVDAYRFSIAWPRVVTSLDGDVNNEGLDFYQQIIDRLHYYSIKPYVTLYHWDLPQYLEDQGGWLNRDVVTAFVYYASVVSDYFGDQVASYATLNEPWCSAMLGYLHGIHAPGFQNRRQALQVGHHLLLAHGKAMPVLRQNAPNASHGIVLNLSPYDAGSDKQDDVLAAKLADEENNQWFLQPLLEAKYPQVIIDKYPECMPKMRAGDMEAITAPLDFIGINYYTRQRIFCDESNDVFGYRSEIPEDSEVTAMGWEVYPEGLFNLISELNERYQLPPLLITENGMAADDEYDEVQINDSVRVSYLREHLYVVKRLIEKGIDLRGYFAWSLMDNFEWAEGFDKRFGLYYVDYETQERIPKLSAYFYKDYIEKTKGQ